MPVALQHTGSFSLGNIYLGHHILATLVGVNLLKLHQLRTHNILNPIIPQINLLSSRVEKRIIGKMYSALAIVK
jgi:hypothetical protein